MIMARNEDGTYSQVGFVKDNDGIDTEYIYDEDGDIVFEKGFTRETSGTVPLTINGIGKDLKAWSITGNTVQNGTPTPENPVETQAVGDRTGNLFDPNATRYHMGKGTNNRIAAVANGAMFYIKAAPNTNYTIKIHTTDSTFVRLYLSNAPIVEGVVESYTVISESETTQNPEVTISNTDYAYLWIQAGGTWYTEHGGSSIMLNYGSTPLPYEPYGYKIPISSANTTTPVYLGEVETTRKIRKLVLTGTETWYAYSSGVVHQFYTQGNRIGGVASSSAYSTIAPYGMTANNRNGNYGCYTVTNGDEIAFQMYGSKADFPTQTEWKAYLSAQYAAGTPVTVWYVLATPETGIVNDPLRKIGGYADTLSMEQAGVQIPTLNGTMVINVDTTVKPTEMYIKYKSSK